MLAATLLSLGVVFVAEHGDRSQPVTMTYALRFRWWVVMAGVAIASFTVHGVSVAIGHFLGATRGATLTRIEGPVLVFGVGLSPCGWAAMLGLDASAAASRLLCADRLLGPDARVARCLAQMFNPLLYPELGPRLEISQAELGFLTGLSRQRVNQALQLLSRRGLLSVEYGSITVLSLDALRSFEE